MKKILFTLALLGLAWQFTFGMNSSGSIVYPFLDISPSARAAALADSVCGLSGDPGSSFSNPSMLAGIKSPQISLTYGKWIVDAAYQNLSAAMDFGFGPMGLQVLYLNLGEFEQRDGNGALLEGKLSSFDISGSLAYAFTPVKDMSAGVAIKIIGQGAAYTGKATVALDAGIQNKFDRLSLGFAVNNIGADPQYGFPVIFRIGASYAYDISADHKVTAGLDEKYLLKEGVTTSLGAEYSYADTVFARLGYRLKAGASQYDVISGFTAGTGVKAGWFMFDYALVSFVDLGLTHRVTVSYVFGKQKTAGDKEKKEVLSNPRQEQAPDLMKDYNAVKASPKDMKAWARLAGDYNKLGNLSYALTTVKEALKISPKDAELNKLKKEFEKAFDAKARGK